VKIIATKKGQGKTTQLIKIAHKSGSYIICESRDEAARVFQEAVKLGMDIRFPLTFSEFHEGRFDRRGCPSFIIDNADLLLQRMARSVPLIAISVTVEE
jgi:hypothetical protein